MGLFGFGRRKKEGTRAFRREMAKKLDGRAIKYVTERTADGGVSNTSHNLSWKTKKASDGTVFGS